MFSTLATVFLAALLIAPQQPDTTITVPARERLDVYTQGGEIAISTWDRNEVQVRASYGSRDRIDVRSSGSVVRVRSQSNRPGPGIVEYEITVPVGMNLELEGLYTDISIEGTNGQVDAVTVQGDVSLRGGGGRVDIETVQGSISVEDARGDVSTHAVGGDIRLQDIAGSIDAETVSGRLVLTNINASRVSAASVSGRIYFDGSIAEGGSYAFASHSGSITVAVPQPLNATVSVAQISGAFNSSVSSLTTSELRRGRRQSFTAGNGSALLELESFSGSIRLANRGDVDPPAPR
jgi:DUF4097 and DUF4098 domain-containing protein YvlB